MAYLLKLCFLIVFVKHTLVKSEIDFIGKNSKFITSFRNEQISIFNVYTIPILIEK